MVQENCRWKTKHGIAGDVLCPVHVALASAQGGVLFDQHPVWSSARSHWPHSSTFMTLSWPSSEASFATETACSSTSACSLQAAQNYREVSMKTGPNLPVPTPPLSMQCQPHPLHHTASIISRECAHQPRLWDSLSFCDRLFKGTEHIKKRAVDVFAVHIYF